MIRRLQSRLTYANVTSTLALFIAMGGASYAAVALPRNSVGAAQLRSASVGSAEVKDRSLQSRDFSARARRALRGSRGATGPAGQPGPAGPSGGAGAVALAYKTVAGRVEAGSVDSRTAICDPGQHVTGGGMRADTGSDTSARESYPNVSNTAWTVRVGNDDPRAAATYTVFAVCAGG
jgi:hypothetical protein